MDNELGMMNGELRKRRALPHSKFSVQHSQFLVIGYGSTLHSDDAVGPRVAEAVAQWFLPNVTTVATTQLAPEHAELVSRAGEVVFVDAAIKPFKPHKPSRSFGLVRLGPALDLNVPGLHVGDPRMLLALCKSVYGTCPRAWLLTVPGHNFDLGESLSPQATRGMEQALEYIQSFVGKNAHRRT